MEKDEGNAGKKVPAAIQLAPVSRGLNRARAGRSERDIRAI